MSDGHSLGASSFETSNAMAQSAAPRAAGGFPSAGDGLDKLSVNVDDTLKAGNIDFGLGGDLSSIMKVEGALNQSPFKFIDDAAFTPFKLATAPIVEPVQSELTKANLSQATSIGSNTNAGLQGNTGAISQGGGQEH